MPKPPPPWAAQPVSEHNRGCNWAIPAHGRTPPMLIVALNLRICSLRTFSVPQRGVRLFLPINFFPFLSFFEGVRAEPCLRVPLPAPALLLSLLYHWKHFPQEFTCIYNFFLVTESQRIWNDTVGCFPCEWGLGNAGIGTVSMVERCGVEKDSVYRRWGLSGDGEMSRSRKLEPGSDQKQSSLGISRDLGERCWVSHFVCILEDKVASAAGGFSWKTSCLVVCEQVQRQKLMVCFHSLQGMEGGQRAHHCSCSTCLGARQRGSKSDLLNERNLLL